jgi:hypothetical protein
VCRQELLTAAKGSIDVVTVHSYGLWGQDHGTPFTGQCNSESFTSPALWERDSPGKPGEPRPWSGRMGMVSLLGRWRETQRKYAAGARIVLSETAVRRASPQSVVHSPYPLYCQSPRLSLADTAHE